MFLYNLEKSAIEKCGLNRTEPIIVGVSGGADSLALMHGLHVLGFNLVIAHLDHAIRPESKAEAAYVAKLAGSLGLAFVGEQIDVKSIAEKEHESLEEAARNVRYEFLFAQALKYNAQAVAVAHHADDQVETILMHFLRGAALPGLSGMSFQKVIPLWNVFIPIVRPLLGFWREEIDAYIAEIGIAPCNDLSNQDTTFFRNRLRHELIPTLETYNPQIRQIIWRMADILNEEDRSLERLCENTWQDYLISTSADLVEIHYYEFLNLGKALKRRILRKAISFIRPDLRDIGFDAIERALTFIEHPSTSGEIDLAACLNLAVVGDVLIVKSWEADLPDWNNPLLPEKTFTQTLSPGEVVNLRCGWRIAASLLQNAPENAADLTMDLNENEAWLDFDRLQMPLLVRRRKKGERWQPLGLDGHSQKISEFMINQKIPTHLRDLWPLVCSEGKIAWVAGIRPSEVYKVTSDTQTILRLFLEHA